MHMLTRICHNSADWWRPSGDAPRLEAAMAYVHKYGLGHEEWIFRSEWLIDGWRYAFLQGVNKNYTKLLKATQPFDGTLFTIQRDKHRRFVATIHDVECLSEEQAKNALKVFKRLGWYDRMVEEIRAVGGDESALGAVEWAKHVLNIRFRLENVERYAPETYADADAPIVSLKRYQLFEFEKYCLTEGEPRLQNKKGRTSLPDGRTFLRRGTSATICNPEHAHMQSQLMKELRAEYPRAKVTREQDFIDVSVQTDKELILFEIKSDLAPRTVIRHALGQILEYAYHPIRKHALPVQLVIVGRKPLSPLDVNYLELLRKQFKLPLTYRVVGL